nr:hypothetical protein [Escherichia coli]
MALPAFDRNGKSLVSG